MMNKKILIHFPYALGDSVVLTAFIRDLRLAHPDCRVSVDCNFPAVWKNNPRVLPYSKDIKYDLEVKLSCLEGRSIIGMHFIEAYHHDFALKTGVDVPCTKIKPELWLDMPELGEPLATVHPYVVLFGGGKRDMPAKWYPESYNQVIVSELDKTYNVINVGQVGPFYHSPIFESATNMLGSTTVRQLMTLVYYASAVVCPVTAGMHIAAAFDTPCVVTAGNREPRAWEKYDGHAYLTGTCPNGWFGCWNKECASPVNLNSINYAMCCAGIYPTRVLKALERIAVC